MNKLDLTVSFDNTPSLMKYFHSHNAYEIYLLISGKTTYLLNEDICNMKEGEIILISPGVFHKTQSESRRRFLFEIKESYLDKYFTKEGKEFKGCLAKARSFYDFMQYINSSNLDKYKDANGEID